MKKFTRNMLALLLAAAMVLSLVPAFAEAPAQTNAQAVLEKGGTLKLASDLVLDTQSLAGLLGMAMGSADEESMAMVTSLITAVNKLKTTAVYNKEAFSLVIGTDTGSVLEAQGVINEETFENTFAVNLLPGIALSFDPAMLQEVAGEAMKDNPLSNMTPQEIEALIQPYGEALAKVLQETLVPQGKTEEGPFEVEGVGTFAQRVTVDVTTYNLADLLGEIVKVYKQDTKLHGIIETFAQSAMTASAAAGATEEAPNPAEALAELEKSVADIRSGPDTKLVTLVLYTSADSVVPQYITAETIQTPGGQAYITILTTSAENSTDLSLAVLFNPAESAGADEGGEDLVGLSTKAPDDAAAETEEAAPAAVDGSTDWAALHQAVMSGEDTKAMLVNLTIKAITTETGVQTDLAADFRGNMDPFGPTYIGLALKETSALGDKLDENGEITLSFMSPSPILTFSFALTETDEQPQAIPADSTPFVLSENTSDEEAAPLTGKLMQEGMPLLMESLKTALPEEAEAITMFVTMLSSQGASVAE